MIKELEGRYFRICDNCGNELEIKKSSFNIMSKKGNKTTLCNSCRQKGEKNHRFKKEPWNKGLTKETNEKVLAYNLKQSITKKGRIPWNKGLTKEMDSRVREYGLKGSKTKTGVRLSKPRKTSYRDKSFSYFRKYIKWDLYLSWKRPIMERDNFSCTSSNLRLEVHHLKPFRDILLEVSKTTELPLNTYNLWNDIELQKFKQCLVASHKIEDGITLCSKCHADIDKSRAKFFIKDKIKKERVKNNYKEKLDFIFNRFQNKNKDEKWKDIYNELAIRFNLSIHTIKYYRRKYDNR